MLDTGLPPSSPVMDPAAPLTTGEGVGDWAPFVLTCLSEIQRSLSVRIRMKMPETELFLSSPVLGSRGPSLWEYGWRCRRLDSNCPHLSWDPVAHPPWANGWRCWRLDSNCPHLSWDPVAHPSWDDDEGAGDWTPISSPVLGSNSSPSVRRRMKVPETGLRLSSSPRTRFIRFLRLVRSSSSAAAASAFSIGVLRFRFVPSHRLPPAGVRRLLAFWL